MLQRSHRLQHRKETGVQTGATPLVNLSCMHDTPHGYVHGTPGSPASARRVNLHLTCVLECSFEAVRVCHITRHHLQPAGSIATCTQGGTSATRRKGGVQSSMQPVGPVGLARRTACCEACIDACTSACSMPGCCASHLLPVLPPRTGPHTWLDREPLLAHGTW